MVLPRCREECGRLPWRLSEMSGEITLGRNAIPMPSKGRAATLSMVAGATIALLALGLTAALPATAATPAQNRYSAFVQGDFTVAGNTFTVPSSFAYLDADADPSVTDEPSNAATSIASSRAGFAIPPGSTIVAGLLYAFQDYGGVPDPIGPPSLLFAPPGQSYASISLTEIGRDSNQSRLLYADVTSQLPANDDGSVWVGSPRTPLPREASGAGRCSSSTPSPERRGGRWSSPTRRARSTRRSRRRAPRCRTSSSHRPVSRT